MQWRSLPGSESAEAGYEVLACVEGRATLFVIVGGPPSNPGPPENREIRATLPSGDRFWARGLSITGDKEDSLVIVKFNHPSVDIPYFDLVMEVDGEVVVSTRLQRVPDQDS